LRHWRVDPHHQVVRARHVRRPEREALAFVLDRHVWSNDKVRVTARNVSALTVDFAAVPLSVQVVNRISP
jgi:hypothetical protein